MGIPDHLTCPLRILCAVKESTVRTLHETTDWFKIGKGVRQGCVLSPCLFNFCTESIMRNAGLPFSSCLQSFSASGSFPGSWFFASGGQRIGVSASVLPGDYLLGKWNKLKHFHPEGPGRVSPHLTIVFILNSQAKDYLGTINNFQFDEVELVSLVSWVTVFFLEDSLY